MRKVNGLNELDISAIDQFKIFLFKQKQEFIKLYDEKGSVYIHVKLGYDVIHLKDNFLKIIDEDFKRLLGDRFSTDALKRLKIDFKGVLENEMFISLDSK